MTRRPSLTYTLAADRYMHKCGMIVCVCVCVCGCVFVMVHICRFTCIFRYTNQRKHVGGAPISRPPKNIVLFCKRAL